MRADVTDESAVKAMISDINANKPPLRGIFHTAMVIDDDTIDNLDWQRFHKVLAPKIEGTWHLHQHTLDQPLDHFVLFSSVSTLIGNHGQSNYVAGNSFLDGFAYYRRQQGLPALVVNWGRISEIGYVARNTEVAESLERRGFLGVSPQKATEAIERLEQYGKIHAAVMRMDWSKQKDSVSWHVSKRSLSFATPSEQINAPVGCTGYRLAGLLRPGEAV